MHLITYLIESIKGKGVTANTSTDGGEALHPQTRKDFTCTNHQATAEDQVSKFNSLLSQRVNRYLDASNGFREGDHPQ
jgi:hypothetical protein